MLSKHSTFPVPVGASKNWFFLPFLTSFSLDDVKLAELSNNSFGRKNVISLGVETYSDPSYVFSGVKTPTL